MVTVLPTAGNAARHGMGMARDGTGWHGMGMAWNGTGWDRMGWDGMGWDGKDTVMEPWGWAQDNKESYRTVAPLSFLPTSRAWWNWALRSLGAPGGHW